MLKVQNASSSTNSEILTVFSESHDVKRAGISKLIEAEVFQIYEVKI